MSIRVNESPDPLERRGQSGSQDEISSQRFGLCELGGTPLVEEYHLILANLQHSRELVGETTNEKPKEEYRNP